mmetsp:Transcript_40320/g.49124  ORF Transcript_40320/g.49124 Transcript_40320/m.49124 type:complete len:93 (-) Transcript_40320:189-467(-)
MFCSLEYHFIFVCQIRRDNSIIHLSTNLGRLATLPIHGLFLPGRTSGLAFGIPTGGIMFIMIKLPTDATNNCFVSKLSLLMTKDRNINDTQE